MTASHMYMWSKNGLLEQRLNASGQELTPLLMDALQVLTSETAAAEQHHYEVQRNKGGS